MFVIIENYKKMLLGIIKNDFASQPESVTNSPDNNGISIDKLIDKALIDQKINKKELLEIQDKYNDEKNKISENTSSQINEFMKNMYKEMLKDGINIGSSRELEDILSRLDKVGLIIDEETKNKFREDVNISSIIYKLKSIAGEFVNGKFESNLIDFDESNNDYVDEGKINFSLANEILKSVQKEPAPVEPAQQEPAQQEPAQQEPIKIKVETKKQKTKFQIQKEYFNTKTETQKKEIQKLLGVEEDGKFGPKTLKAILDFQKVNNLQTDGKVGPITLGKLKELNELNKVKELSKSSNEVDKIFEDTSDKNTEELDKEKEIVFDEKEINDKGITFIGKNGEEVSVEYDPKTKKLFINTSYFDGVDDFYILDKEFDFKDEASLYATNNISKIKEEYDRKVIDNSKKEENE